MKNKNLKTVCEGAVLIALSLALSYLEIPIGLAFGGFGGSITLAMIPIVVFAMRRGCLWGLGAGFVFGTLKFFLTGGVAVNWQSMLLDYSVAYMFLGFGGLCRGNYLAGSVVACLSRFAVHFFSGITIYAIVIPTEIMGLTTGSAAIFSVLYNGSYMLPSSIITVIACVLLSKPMEKLAK